MGGGRRRPWYVDIGAAIVVLALVGVIGVRLNSRSGGSAPTSTLPIDDVPEQVGPTEPRTVETVPVVTGSVPATVRDDDSGKGGGATRSTLPREQRATVSGTAAAVSRLVLRNASGAEATVEIRRGKLQGYAEGATHGAVLGDECDYDHCRSQPASGRGRRYWGDFHYGTGRRIRGESGRSSNVVFDHRSGRRGDRGDRARLYHPQPFIIPHPFEVSRRLKCRFDLLRQ